MEKNKNSNKKSDSNIREKFVLYEPKKDTRDVKFGIYGNVSGKSMPHLKIDFDGL